MKQPIRFFSIGLFTASFIIFIIFLFNHTSNKENDLTVDEMIESIETDGYRVLTEEEYITYTVNKDLAHEDTKKENAKSKEKKPKDKENNNKEKEDKQKSDQSDRSDEKNNKKDQSVKKYTVKIKSGMMPEEVARLLEENDIIDDAFSFATYLEDNGYSPYVQIDSFKLTSDMSRKEIAEKITKNRRP